MEMTARFLRFTADPGAAGRQEIWCGDQRAFLFQSGHQPPVILPGLCPHRGGPLALGSYDCRSRSLQCPWHGQRHGLGKLQEMALPAIRTGAAWLVAFPASEGGQDDSAVEIVTVTRHAAEPVRHAAE